MNPLFETNHFQTLLNFVLKKVLVQVLVCHPGLHYKSFYHTMIPTDAKISS